MAKASEEVKDFLRAIGRKGGKTRAERHSKAEMSEWASLGGWPKGKPRGPRKKKARKGGRKGT